MFDKDNVNNAEIFIASREYKAPTDDSIRLAAEFEEKAMAKVVRVLNLGNDNFIKGTLIASNFNCFSLEYLVTLIFSLNGIEHKIEKRIPKEELDICFKPINAYKYFIEQMSSAVAQKMADDLTGLYIKEIEPKQLS